MIEVICPSPDDTRGLARRLASLLRAGDILLLKGHLGAGKTVFACGIAEGLGVQEQVTSPTFVLSRRYEGFMPLIHADMYRVGSSAELDDLDLLEESDQGVLVVEWGDVAEKQFGNDHLLVEILPEDDGSRLVRLIPSGTWPERPLGEVVT